MAADLPSSTGSQNGDFLPQNILEKPYYSFTLSN
jgi:hypothetical protein